MVNEFLYLVRKEAEANFATHCTGYRWHLNDNRRLLLITARDRILEGYIRLFRRNERFMTTIQITPVPSISSKVILDIGSNQESKPVCHSS
jgi:hypothetical protein